MSMRSALAHRDFRRLVAALAVSQAGDWLYNVALLVFVFDRTHSVLWVSVTTAVRVIPVVVLSPLGGVLADRYDRRRLMILADLVRAALMALLTAVVVLGGPVVLAPILAGLATVAASVYAPATGASTQRLVPAEELPGANAVRSIVGPACVIGGPAVGALLLTLTGPGTLFAINAATFVASALLLLAIGPRPAFVPTPSDEAPEGLLQQLAAGLAELKRHPVAVRFVGADILCSVVYGAETVLLVLVSRQLGWGDHGYGLLLAATGAGGVVGTALVGRLSRLSRMSRIVGVALLAAGAPLVLIAASPTIALAMLLCAVNGAGSLIVEVFAETALQQQLDEAVFGRAYGFAFPASIAGIVVGSVIAAPLVALVGLTGALVVLALVVGAYAAVLLIRIPVRTVAAA